MAFAAALAAVSVSPASAQTLQIHYERELGAYRYRFANPSTFDTAQLVPHFFEQKYDTGNDWLTGELQYGHRVRASSEAGVSREATRSATDFDTFFEPSGDVVTSGTSGGAKMRAWRVRQTVDAGRMHVGYAFRRDTADFLAGNKSVTHSAPPSVDYSIVATRETTHSDVHEILIGAGGQLARRSARNDGWKLAWTIDAVPAAIARLTVLLPDKYPGQSLPFVATAVGANGGVTARRRGARASIDLGIRIEGAHSYLHSSQFSRHAVLFSGGVDW